MGQRLHQWWQSFLGDSLVVVCHPRTTAPCPCSCTMTTGEVWWLHHPCCLSVHCVLRRIQAHDIRVNGRISDRVAFAKQESVAVDALTSKSVTVAHRQKAGLLSGVYMRHFAAQIMIILTVVQQRVCDSL